ncbi:MAG: response regulator [Magnetococcus sp. YQC-5]
MIYTVKPSILIVDDVVENLDLLKNLLMDEYAIRPATHGALALRLAALDPKPDLILLDIMMPGMSGLEVCKRLKADPGTASIPIIFLSALDQTDFKAEGFKLGAVDYIVKPFSLKEVKIRVQTHLALRKLQHSLEEQVAVRTEELSRALYEAQFADLVKSEFMARIGHELLTPLNAIIAPSVMMISRATDPHDKSQLEGIHDAAVHLFRLITDLLDFSSLERAGDQNEVVFHLDDWLNGIKKEWSVRAERKGLEFLLQVGSVPTPMPCIGDIRRLNQAVEQLLDNALKFTDAGTILLSVTPVGSKQGRLAFRFEIVDTGIGMQPEFLQTLFEPFTQAESTFTRRYKGMGLGVALTKRLVARLGGELCVESRPNHGSRFSFIVAFAPGQMNACESMVSVAPAEIVDQLNHLTELVDNGFRDIDSFLSKIIRCWQATPWSHELQEIVDSVNRYDKDRTLEFIATLQNKLSNR